MFNNPFYYPRKVLLLLGGIMLFFFVSGKVFSQVDLIDANNYVYTFLERMYNKGFIKDYVFSSLPLSRESVSKLLIEVNDHQNYLSSADKSQLKKYLVEFETNSGMNESSFFSKPQDIFDNTKQKYLYIYKDSTFNFYLDGIGGLTERISRGDSLGNHKSLVGELGFRFRGNFNGILAAYLRASNNAQISGDINDFYFVRNTNPKINSTGTVANSNRTYYSTYEGYLRYQAKTNWIAVSIGRYQLVQGTGFLDNMFLSRNGIPFDFAKLDLNTKPIKYSFLYGSIRGDSVGKRLDSKNIVSHRIDLNFANNFKMGIFESLIISNSPFNFTYLNPISFLTAAEFNKASQGNNEDINNSLLGFDFFYKPANNISLQGSFLVDDLEFSTLFKSDSVKINKFGFQAGTFWTDAFTIPNLDLKLEYTRLDPFIYSHSTNKSTYANWNYSLGHSLPPNSDEIALKLEYAVSARLRFDLGYKFQRSAGGFLTDSNGNILINYGGDINNASRESESNPEFLKGNRVNRKILELNVDFEPIKQYYLNFNYINKIFDNIFENRKLTDNYFTFGLKVDY